MKDERELLHAAKSGNNEAFSQLAAMYGSQVFNNAFRLCGNAEDAGDLAQEVFIKAYRNITKFEERSRFSTWLYRITVNLCIDFLKKQKYNVSIDEENESGQIMEFVDNSHNPEREFEKNEQRKMINSAIARLSPEHRKIIVLRDINDYSYEEMAEILKCPIGTVKSRINRARSALRKLISSGT